MPEVRRHYRLEHQEWSQVWKDLRPSEIRILYHLRTLDPFGDRKLNIKVRQMGRDLGMAHSTVSKALKVLDDKGYIELDLVEVDLKILSKAGVVPGGTTRGRSTEL